MAQSGLELEMNDLSIDDVMEVLDTLYVMHAAEKRLVERGQDQDAFGNQFALEVAIEAIHERFEIPGMRFSGYRIVPRPRGDDSTN
jgi:hypothetical protein